MTLNDIVKVISVVRKLFKFNIANRRPTWTFK